MTRTSLLSLQGFGAAFCLLHAACGNQTASVGDETKSSETAATSNTTAPNRAMSDQELREKLTDLQYQVTRESGTEPAFKNAFWDNKKPGIYVDIISGKPLFSSTTKFASGTGWPSFYASLDEAEVLEVDDRKFGMVRTEVRSKTGDTHLGHLFDDGPAPTGQRFCINSASLRFVPAEDLEKEGLGKYAALFADEEGGDSTKKGGAESEAKE